MGIINNVANPIHFLVDEHRLLPLARGVQFFARAHDPRDAARGILEGGVVPAGLVGVELAIVLTFYVGVVLLNCRRDISIGSDYVLHARVVIIDRR